MTWLVYRQVPELSMVLLLHGFTHISVHICGLVVYHPPNRVCTNKNVVIVPPYFLIVRCKLATRRNLVDPASSHMLVSKIKPCMFTIKSLHDESANGSLKQFYSTP